MSQKSRCTIHTLKSGGFFLCIEDTARINLFNSFVEDKVVALGTEQATRSNVKT